MDKEAKCEFPVITTASGFSDGPMYAWIGPGKFDREKQSNGGVSFEWPEPTRGTRGGRGRDVQLLQRAVAHGHGHAPQG